MTLQSKLCKFFAMILIIARKTINAVFGTMALQLTKVVQRSVTYSMKQTSRSFDCCNTFIVCNCSFNFGTKSTPDYRFQSSANILQRLVLLLRKFNITSR